ncbi:MAG: hypothetical protein J6S14_02150 [Clostridia bacterium]|nr:hypothetical protein [Clostridia bacterium]
MYDNDIKVVFVRSKQRADLRKIRSDLLEISEREATYLFRLARKMRQHGCSPASVAKCREEAYKLHMNAYPERLIDSSIRWEYAFKV